MSNHLFSNRWKQALVWRMLEQSEHVRAYDTESVEFYRNVTGRTVGATHVQTALEALRGLTPPVVWKSARSEYSIEETAMHPWYRQRVNAQLWPPTSPQAKRQPSKKSQPSPRG